MHSPRRAVPSLASPPRARSIAKWRPNRRLRPILPIRRKEDNECKRGGNRKDGRLQEARAKSWLRMGDRFKSVLTSRRKSETASTISTRRRFSSISMRSSEMFRGWRIALKQWACAYAPMRRPTSRPISHCTRSSTAERVAFVVRKFQKPKHWLMPGSRTCLFLTR